MTNQGIETIENFVSEQTGLDPSRIRVNTWDDAESFELNISVVIQGFGITPGDEVEDLENAINSIMDRETSVDVQISMPSGNNSGYAVDNEIDEETVDEVIDAEHVPYGFELETEAMDKLSQIAAEATEAMGHRVIESMGELSEAVTESVMAESITTNDWILEDIETGTAVIVENRDGTHTHGEVRQIVKETVQDFNVSGTSNTLYEYWDEEIEPKEKVVKVSIADAGQSYDYPHSKISIDTQELSGIGNSKAGALRDNGFHTVTDVYEATQQKLAAIDGIGNALAARAKASAKNDFSIAEKSIPDGSIHIGYECPNCEDSFYEDSPEAIEGDEGKMYCSLECLNMVYQ